MRIKWVKEGEAHRAEWEGREVAVSRELGVWRIYVDGERTAGEYRSPQAAMDAVADAADRLVAARGARVRALQPPPYGTWCRGEAAHA